MLEGGKRFKKLDNNSIMPLLSVITVVFNRANYLEDAIKSIVCQSYRNFEYIVIDGNSSDGTLDIIKKYSDEIDYWISEPDGGMYFALNKGIELARGKWIGILHSDDYLYDENCLDKIAAELEFADFDILHSDIYSIISESNEEAKIYQVSSDENIIASRNSIIHPTVYIRKTVFEKYGNYDISYKSASDYELMVRLKIKNLKFHHLPQVTMFIRDFNSERVSNNCYGMLEANKFHKFHRTGYEKIYQKLYWYCIIRNLMLKIFPFLEIEKHAFLLFIKNLLKKSIISK